MNTFMRIRYFNTCAFAFLGLLGAEGFCAEAVKPLSFGGPEVLKLDWSTRSLSSVDLNGDGLNDLALINNDTTRVELLYQLEAGHDGADRATAVQRNRWQPVLESAGFEGEGITIGYSMYDLQVGDLNGDGRPDLAYTAREVPLTVRLQNANGAWPEPVEFNAFEALGWTNTVEIADLDRDGRLELIVVAADAVRVFNINGGDQLEAAGVYSLTGENPFNLMVADVTGDERADILYITANGKQSLVLREQLQGGGFGPERRFVFDRPVRKVRLLPGKQGLETRFCAIDSRSGALDFFRLERGRIDAHTDGILHAQPEVYPVLQKGRDAASYALGDLNGDGLEDLLVGDPASAELVLFLQGDEGFEMAGDFPSFAKIASMSCGHFFEGAAAQAIVLSVEEQALGFCSLDRAGRLSFPALIDLEGMKPVVCEAVDLDADGLHELALVVEGADKKLSLRLLAPADRVEPGRGWEIRSECELKGLRRKPESIRELDVFDQGARGLVILVPREAPVLVVPDAEGLEELGRDSALRESLLKGVSRAQLSAFDVDGDGVKELVVGREGYARALKIADGKLTMVDQFNARHAEDYVEAVVPHLEAGDLRGLFFYVSGGREFQYLEKEEDGVFRYKTSSEVGALDLVDWARLEVGEDGEALLMAGAGQFWLLPRRAASWSMKFASSYETELKDVHYTNLQGADFNDDGLMDLIAVDGSSHVVEVLKQSEDSWKRHMYWEIFEQNMHYQGRTGNQIEPKQVMIADLTGDGRLDFCFLIHDRILFYPQQ